MEQGCGTMSASLLPRPQATTTTSYMDGWMDGKPHGRRVTRYFEEEKQTCRMRSAIVRFEWKKVWDYLLRDLCLCY